MRTSPPSPFCALNTLLATAAVVLGGCDPEPAPEDASDAVDGVDVVDVVDVVDLDIEPLAIPSFIDEVEYDGEVLECDRGPVLVDRMEIILQENPQLLADYGKSTVDSCEDAERVGRLMHPQLAFTDEDQPSTMELLDDDDFRLWNGFLQFGNYGSVRLGVGFSSCSGVLIHPRVILTAGHCSPLVANDGYTNTTVDGVVSGTTVATVFNGSARWIRRPGYVSGTYEHTDLAAVVLPSSINQLNTMAVWDGNLSLGTVFNLWGWGLPSYQAKVGSTWLDYIDWGSVGFLGDSYPGPLACRGDSGGGWSVYLDIAFGIHSNAWIPAGHACNTQGTWAFGHRLAESDWWIRSLFQNNCDDYGHWFDCSNDDLM